jgi:hypothetical protein
MLVVLYLMNGRVDIGSLVVPYREGQEVLASWAVLHITSQTLEQVTLGNQINHEIKMK